MRTMLTAIERGTRRRWVGRTGVLVLIPLFLAAGCSRALTIRQDPYINTAVHADREKQTGDPLELTIVCVYPADLDKSENALLRPGQKITSKEWYDKRPVLGTAAGNRFNLPASQIFLFSDDKNAYGTRIGDRLRGSVYDGDQPVTRSGINFDGGWGGARFHDPKSVIYVFAKFTDKNGTVLPVTPAVFHPPGAYAPHLEVKIGVDPNQKRLEDAQYIRNTSERKMHGKGDDR